MAKKYICDRCKSEDNEMATLKEGTRSYDLCFKCLGEFEVFMGIEKKVPIIRGFE